MRATREQADGLRLGDPTMWIRRQVVPFAVFMGFLLLLQLAGVFFKVDLPSQPWWRRAPEYWIYPLQAVVCMVLVIRWWSSYEFRWSWRWSLVGVAAGVVGIGFWILPTHLYDVLGLDEGGWWERLGVAPRRDGFNPGELFEVGSGAWWAALVGRMVRAAVAVAFIEEIFWRSFAMRLATDWDGDYWKRPFGEASWRSYALVTGLFMLAHAPVDYAGAWIYGSLTYGLCVWSKNLGACVVMHFTANLVMGLYAMGFEKYGLW